jgi:hypothetical protein
LFSPLRRRDADRPDDIEIQGKIADAVNYRAGGLPCYETFGAMRNIA